MGKHACIPRSIVLPKQQVGVYCGDFPPCGLQGKYFPLHVVLVYSLLHCQTVVQILHHFTVTVNDVEVTVNTCTCTDMFTIITIKDQSDGQVARGLWLW